MATGGTHRRRQTVQADIKSDFSEQRLPDHDAAVEKPAAIEAEVNLVRSLTIVALRQLWRAMSRAAPPSGLNRAMLAVVLNSW